MSLGFLKEAIALVPLIVMAVKSVEKLFHKDPTKTPVQNNKDRQDSAVELVGEYLPIMEAWIDRDVVNEALVQSALRKVIDALVALFNVVADVKAKRAAAQPVP